MHRDVTGRLARSASEHPWRTLALWAAAILVSVVTIGALLGSSLTTDSRMTNDPESYRAYDLVAAHFPPSNDYVNELVVVRSTAHVVGEPVFRRKVEPTREAVAHAVASTARIITGAALIIIAVFVGFAAGDQVEFQQMGFGVAVSLLIDATLVRLVLLPAVLTLLGERSWYLPRWLGWLPHLEIDSPSGARKKPSPAA